MKFGFSRKKTGLTFGSLKTTTNNLGDNIQILAMLRLLDERGIVPEIFIDRDHDIAKSKKFTLPDGKLFLVMSGWHKVNGKQWPPNKKVLPLFYSFHIRQTKCPQLLSDKAIQYYKLHEPIGCRDEHTVKLLVDKGVQAYETHCLTLTLPERNLAHTPKKIFVASRDRDIYRILPNEIKENSEYVNHYSDTTDFGLNNIQSKALYERYKNEASLVITTFLHCAMPCIAMGIPVIIFYPEKGGGGGQSDKERFSSLAKITKIYSFDEAPQVEWNPAALDIRALKNSIIHDFNARLDQVLHAQVQR